MDQRVILIVIDLCGVRLGESIDDYYLNLGLTLLNANKWKVSFYKIAECRTTG